MSSTTHPTPRSVVVTGGAGFIGAEVVHQLRAAGRPVTVIDRLDGSRQRDAAQELVEAGAEVVAADLRDLDLVRLVQDVAGVVHLAGRPGVQQSWGPDFDHYLDDNVATTGRLLHAVADLGETSDATANLPRIVLASSSSVYGSVPHGLASERTPPAPLSPYGVSKAAVELLAGTYAARGVPVVSLRFFTVYGRRQRPDMAVSRMIEAAITGAPFFVRGDGHQERDYTHVADVARATIAALDADLPAGAAINVGSAHPVSLLDMVDRVGGVVGRPVPVVPAPCAAGDPERTAADRTLAATVLGWRPEVDLDVGLADQVRHHERVEAARALG